jgi:hypothetical protein
MLEMSRTIAIAEPELSSITISSTFDADILQRMLVDNSIPSNDKAFLKTFYKRKRSHNTVVDEYEYKRNNEQIGRIYCFTQSLKKEYRNAIIGAGCIELDIENCHYHLLSQIADRYGLRNDALKNYVENRDKCLSELHPDRTTAKELYLTAQYGGDVRQYEKLEKITEECKAVLFCMLADKGLSHIYKHAKKEFDRKQVLHKSLNHSFMSYVLQTIENRCIVSMHNYLNINLIGQKLINHDGIILPAPEDLDIGDMTEHIRIGTGWNVNIKRKELVQTYETPVDKFITVENEQDVCEYLFKHHSNDIKRCVDGFYIRNKDQLHYSKGEEGLRVLVKNICFKKTTLSGVSHFSSTTKGMESIISFIDKNMADYFPVDELFIERVNNYTRGKVYYRNKFYDLTNKTWSDIPLSQLPIVFIDRDAPDLSTITPEQVKNYKEVYFNMFDEKQLEVVMNMTARAVAGYLDKSWTIISGLRNSGKGLFQTAVFDAFREYCANIDLPMMKSQNSGDASQFRWALSAQTHMKRMAFTNEASSIEGRKLKIDGNVIKKIVSGGDYIQTRGHYKDEVNIIFNAHVFACVNSIPESDPVDAMMTCLPIRMPYKYVDEPADICEKLSDPLIKEKVIENNNKDIFTKIVFDAYKATGVKLKDMTADDQDEYKNCIMEKATEAPYIFREMLVKDPEGWISTEDLIAVFKPSGLNASNLGKFLSARMTASKRRVKCPITGKSKQVYGYSGYRLKAGDNADDNGEESEGEDC